MADDLVFPHEDALSLIEGLSQNNLIEDALTNDINPAFPMSELLNIPQLVPPIMSPNEDRRTFNAPNNITNDMQYTPISQLMKQTEQLAATLDRPLNSQLNEQVKFNNVHQTPGGNNQLTSNNLRHQNQMLNTSTNYGSNSNIDAARNAQCLVVGGQRISIPPSQILSPLSSQISSIHIPSSEHEGPTNINLSNVVVEQNATSSNNSKQPSMLKLPPAVQNSKVPVKGQIVKTADQRLMFVTEVNGKRVGYLIQQSKQNTTQPLTQQTNKHGVGSVQTIHVVNNSLNSPVVNNNLNNPLIVNNNQELNVTGRCSDDVIVIDSPTSPTTQPLTVQNNIDTLDNVSKVTELPILGKKEFRTKNLKEKLLLLRNPVNIKNQLNLKSTLNLPSMNKTQKIVSSGVFKNQNTVHVNPVSRVVPTVNMMVEESDNAMEVELVNDENQSPEEEGQEIEFSENDLSDFNINESSSDGILSPNSSRFKSNDALCVRTISTDDEDSVPLAHLKDDEDRESVDKTYDKSKPAKKIKGKKKSIDSVPLSVVAASLKKGEGTDDTDGKDKKKRGKGKKKKKDPREPTKPLLAYQIFFREVQAKIREDDPQLSFGEVSKVVGQMWEVLEDKKKKVYQDKHESSKIEYTEKMALYKELIAKEGAGSPLPSPSFDTSIAENDDQEDVVPKKTGKRIIKRKESKKSPVRKKSSMDPKSDIFNSETNNLNVEKKAKRKSVKNIENDDAPSSPSLPSSDSSSNEEEDEEDTAISRIRQKAAELTKKIKKEKKAVKSKLKDTVKKNRVTKMEVETIEENTKFIQDDQMETTMKVKTIAEDTLVREAIEEKVEEKPPPRTGFRIPKKPNTENGPVVPRICVRESCKKPVKVSRERGAQYCSNDCLVLYCREVFDSWVLDRQAEESNGMT